MDKVDVKKRMKELMEPINQQIMMCDNPQDLLMIACCMMEATHRIFVGELGEAGARLMYEDLIEPV